ncbi:MAG: hypothetical protein A2Z16_04575 [Chloroflexi bacterium RBG_16_54_18]|nr:MAG: hypothetical protein A2Z16_04575 [Chloroflexi bacterium RBG_16_54_18]
MSTTGIQRRFAPTVFSHLRVQRGMAFGVIILSALFAFEIFNYSTTDYALTDLLGNLKFAGVRWATILAIAFCGIDFAGIARLFTPEKGGRESTEVWYLFGAWLLAATMNAMLTWWGVSLAILNHDTLGNAVIGRETMLRVAPIFVAVLVWLIRVLIIGTFSAAGDRLFSMDERRPQPTLRTSQQVAAASQNAASPMPARTMSSQSPASRYRATSEASYNPAPKPAAQAGSSHGETGHTRPEPTYQSFSMSGERREPGALPTSPGRPGTRRR